MNVLRIAKSPLSTSIMKNGRSGSTFLFDRIPCYYCCHRRNSSLVLIICNGERLNKEISRREHDSHIFPNWLSIIQFISGCLWCNTESGQQSSSTSTWKRRVKQVNIEFKLNRSCSLRDFYTYYELDQFALFRH